MAFVLWHTLPCLKGHQQRFPGKAQNTAWLICAERGHSQSLSHTARPPLPWLGARLVIAQPPPCEICVLRTSLIPDPWKHTCSLRGMAGCLPWNDILEAAYKDPNVGCQFVCVDYCCAFCTQMPKQMANGCSHPGRGRSSYRHWQSCLWLPIKRGTIPVFHVISLPAHPAHFAFPQLLTSMKWWWGSVE